MDITPQLAVYEVVSRLGAARGWNDHSKIHRATGIDRGTLARWREGGGGRTDWFDRFEEAYPLPRGTLLDVYEGRRTPDDIMEAHRPGASVAFRSGRQDTETEAAQRLAADAELEQARRVMEQRETAFAVVGRSVGRLGHELVDDPGLLPHPDIVVRTADGETVVVEVTGGLGHDLDEDITSMVGEQARWRAAGVDRVIMFAYVDWPKPVIEEIAKFGVEYAGSQEELERLLADR